MQHLPSLATKIGPLTIANPVLTASGTCGYGEELARLIDINRLGGIIGKTVTRQPRGGNAAPRTCETPSGMLNAIGLQNMGIQQFLQKQLPLLVQLSLPIIVNIAGESIEDFASLAAKIDGEQGVSGIELNISCPNVAHGLNFAVDSIQTQAVVQAVRKVTSLPLITKLSPNVTDITVIAKAAQDGGSDILSMTNTFLGTAIDIERQKPLLANITGGLSGPAIKPLSLLAVYRCAQVVTIPIIGVGGIRTASDAIEYLLAGASAVQVGTATFVQPDAALAVIDGITDYLQERDIRSVQEIIGKALPQKS